MSSCWSSCYIAGEWQTMGGRADEKVKKRDTWYEAFVWQYNEAGPRKAKKRRSGQVVTKKGLLK